MYRKLWRGFHAAFFAQCLKRSFFPLIPDWSEDTDREPVSKPARQHESLRVKPTASGDCPSTCNTGAVRCQLSSQGQQRYSLQGNGSGRWWLVQWRQGKGNIIVSLHFSGSSGGIQEQGQSGWTSTRGAETLSSHEVSSPSMLLNSDVVFSLQ